VFKLSRLCRIIQFRLIIDSIANCELGLSRGVFTKVLRMTNGLAYCVPGNAVPTVKITLGTPFRGDPAGNDPCFRVCAYANIRMRLQQGS